MRDEILRTTHASLPCLMFIYLPSSCLRAWLLTQEGLLLRLSRLAPVGLGENGE